MRTFHTLRGFTLIELLLYVSISSVLLLVLSLFLSTLLEARIKNQTIAEVEQQGAQAMQLITQTIRNADAINTPARGTSATTLSLTTYAASNNPTVFSLSNGVLSITEGTNAAVELTNARVVVSNVLFFNLSRAGTPGTVSVQFTIATVNATARNEYNYAKTFYGSASLRQP